MTYCPWCYEEAPRPARCAMSPTECPHCGGTYSLDYGRRGDDEYECLEPVDAPPTEQGPPPK
jgi:hypothetical protein